MPPFVNQISITGISCNDNHKISYSRTHLIMSYSIELKYFTLSLLHVKCLFISISFCGAVPTCYNVKNRYGISHASNNNLKFTHNGCTQ